MAHEQQQGSLGSAMTWMSLLSIVLFWLPGIGPFVAGFVGGKKAGGVKNAVIAVFLPAIISGIVLFILVGYLTKLPLIGAVAGMGGAVLSLIHIVPLLLGAIIGAKFQ